MRFNVGDQVVHVEHPELIGSVYEAINENGWSGYYVLPRAETELPDHVTRHLLWIDEKDVEQYG